jgi:hypothetical protein
MLLYDQCAHSRVLHAMVIDLIASGTDIFLFCEMQTYHERGDGA